jgi:hypothetical protein
MKFLLEEAMTVLVAFGLGMGAVVVADHYNNHRETAKLPPGQFTVRRPENVYVNDMKVGDRGYKSTVFLRICHDGRVFIGDNTYLSFERKDEDDMAVEKREDGLYVAVPHSAKLEVDGDCLANNLYSLPIKSITLGEVK